MVLKARRFLTFELGQLVFHELLVEFVGTHAENSRVLQYLILVVLVEILVFGVNLEIIGSAALYLRLIYFKPLKQKFLVLLRQAIEINLLVLGAEVVDVVVDVVDVYFGGGLGAVVVGALLFVHLDVSFRHGRRLPQGSIYLLLIIHLLATLLCLQSTSGAIGRYLSTHRP